MAHEAPTARIFTRCTAPAEAVYDILADLRSHQHWAGERQRRDFRLVTLDAPAGTASVGTTFSSTGTIPMSLRRWVDHSRVTVADRARAFEFVTDATAGSGPRAMTARYVHRYDIAPAAGGSTITYTLTEEHAAHPMLRMGLPGIRGITWRFMVPMFAGRGVRNLARMAEAAAPARLAHTAS